MTDTLIDFPPNCPRCGGALLTWDQLLALAAIASTSKAAGASRLAEDAQAEARRRRPAQEGERLADPQHQT